MIRHLLLAVTLAAAIPAAQAQGTIKIGLVTALSGHRRAPARPSRAAS